MSIKVLRKNLAITARRLQAMAAELNVVGEQLINIRRDLEYLEHDAPKKLAIEMAYPRRKRKRVKATSN